MHLTIHLFNDTDADDPLENCDGMWRMDLEKDNHITYSDVNDLPMLSIGMRRKLQVGTAFPLYSSNLGYSISRDFDGDFDDVKGFFVFDNPKDMGAKTRDDRYKDAESDIKVWQDWREGNVYGYRFDSEELQDAPSCIGYYGTDSLVEAVQEEIRGLLLSKDIQAVEEDTEQTDDGTLYIKLDGEAKWIFDYSYLIDTKVCGGEWVSSERWERAK